VHGFRCYDNIAPRVLAIAAMTGIDSIQANEKCQRVHVCTGSMPGYSLLWPPYVIEQAIIFLPCGFYLSSFLSSIFFLA